MKIYILGEGNVGTHLYSAFSEADLNVCLQSARNLTENIGDGDVYLIAVKDDAILSVARKLAESGCVKSGAIVAHTSGSVELHSLQEELKGHNLKTGVFYPLQTFTKGRAMEYSSLPFLIEGEDKPTEDKLLELAGKVSGKVMAADSELRGKYHLGAVIACNFSNYLCGLADEYLSKNNLDFKMMLPLLRQMVDKLEYLTPAEAQTGPASRGDRGIVEAQVKKLEEFPEIQTMYKLLSESILKKYGG